MDKELRKFKDAQYDYARKNMNHKNFNPVTGWLDTNLRDRQAIRNRKVRY